MPEEVVFLFCLARIRDWKPGRKSKIPSHLEFSSLTKFFGGKSKTNENIRVRLVVEVKACWKFLPSTVGVDVAEA